MKKKRPPKKLSLPSEPEPAATTWKYESINFEVAARNRKPRKGRSDAKWAEQVASMAKQERLKREERERIQHEVWELVNGKVGDESEAIKLIRYQAAGLSGYAEELRNKALADDSLAAFAADQLFQATEQMVKALSEIAGTRSKSLAAESNASSGLAAEGLHAIHAHTQRELEMLRKREGRKKSGTSRTHYDKDYRNFCDDVLDAAMDHFGRSNEVFEAEVLPKHPFAIGNGKAADVLRSQWVRLLTRIMKRRHEAGDFKTPWRSRQTQTSRIFNELWDERVEARARKHTRKYKLNLPE